MPRWLSLSCPVCHVRRNSDDSDALCTTCHDNEHSDEYEASYIKTYISSVRDRVWDTVQKVAFHPESYTSLGQVPQCSFLLHGPSGTGKSTLPWRMAMATGRHLVNINCLGFLDNYEGFVRTLSAHSCDCYRHVSECVFVLEEFDNFVRKVQEAENNAKKCASKWGDDWSTDVGKSSERPPPKDDEEKEDKPDKATGTVATNHMTIKGLLTAIQGATPNPGRILFFSTNDKEYISSVCPALTRDGRMTSIEVGNWTSRELDEFTKQRWNKSLPDSVEKDCTYQPSMVIYRAMGKSFEEFIQVLGGLATAAAANQDHDQHDH